MDPCLPPGTEAFRAEARAWLAGHVPRAPLASLETERGFDEHREWERTLHAGGWSVVSWPRRFGGRDGSPAEWLVFEEEYWAAGAPARVSQNGVCLLAPTLFEHGTDEQRERILPPMASGETVWAQAWSEPGAGSDLAALRSAARRTAGGWLLSGHKTWSSRAAFADWAFGLFRSHPAGPRPQDGLTYAMFPLDADGVTVRPIGRLDGKPAFAEVFLDDVFVPDADVVGEPGRGWHVAMSTAGSERGLTLRAPGRFVAAARRLVALWRTAADPGDTALRDRVADAVIRARAYQLYGYALAARPAAGATAAEASLTKVFWSELDLALHETALDLLGPHGELADTADEAPRGGGWAEGWTFALAGPVYAGTNEMQRDVVAERLLGLPKGRRAGAGDAEAAPRRRGAPGAGFRVPRGFPMDAGQADFARTLDRMFAASGTAAAVRAWARGERKPGLALWERAAEAGVFVLAAPEAYGGVGPLPVELGAAFVELGRHCVPGPLVETVAAAVLLGRLAESGEAAPAKRWLPRLCAGDAIATLTPPGGGPYALDPDAARLVFTVTGDGDTLRLADGHGPLQPSLDPARRLARPHGGGELVAVGPAVREAVEHAAAWAAYATAAQALGVGLALLEKAVSHAGERRQFGVAIGSFQAVKHRLADTLIGLEFAGPLLHGAARALAAGGDRHDGPAGTLADVAAAKAAACDAAYAAARTALQAHGAIGYTSELDLSLWIGKARALRTAWGTPAECRSKLFHT